MLALVCRGSKGGPALSKIVDPFLELKVSWSSSDPNHHVTLFDQLLPWSSSWKTESGPVSNC